MSDHDPYAPSRHQRVHEVQAPVDSLAARMRALGASDDEINAVRAAWDPEAPIEASDDELADDLASVRQEWSAGTGEPVVLHVPQGSVEQVLRWVAEDPDRARAALAAEEDAAGSQRVTLIRALRARLGYPSDENDETPEA